MDNNVTDITVFLSKIAENKKKLKKSHYVFRGHANKDWELAPKIGRKIPKLEKSRIQDFNVLEEKINTDFKRWIPSFYPHFPEDILSTICLGQHYGLSTRLLDWTENPLIALWFALNNELYEESDDDAAVWLLGFDDDDVLKVDQDFKLENLNRTKILFPKFNDKRISSQSSIFTIHRLNEASGNFVSLERNKYFKRNITKLIFEKQNLLTLKRELSLLLTKHMIYQDMGALCDDINNKHALGFDLLSL